MDEASTAAEYRLHAQLELLQASRALCATDLRIARRELNSLRIGMAERGLGQLDREIADTRITLDLARVESGSYRREFLASASTRRSDDIAELAREIRRANADLEERDTDDDEDTSPSQEEIDRLLDLYPTGYYTGREGSTY